MSVSIVVNGVTRELWDDTARLYKTFSAAGAELSSRAFTSTENLEADIRFVEAGTASNRQTLEEQAGIALAGNKAFLAIAGTPTNAQILAQVKLLTKECTAVIRLLLNRLDGTD